MSSGERQRLGNSLSKDGDRIADSLREKRDVAADAAEDAKENVKEGADKAAQKAEETKEQAKANAEKAKEKTKEAAEEAKEKAVEVKDNIVQRLREDGVVNPAGLQMAAFGGVFLAAIPLTSWISSPGGVLEKAVNGVCHSVVYLGTAGRTSAIAQTSKIAALSTLYVAMTYAISGAGSAAGIAAGNEDGRDNKEPRKQVANLRGLPLRLHSAHYNMMEMFPGFAIGAALSAALAPTDQGLVNLLGLHVLAKVFVHYPAYLLGYDQPRTLAHIIATASVINVSLRLAKRGLLV
nr:hypothetical protein B0A51_16275 [Rachicladosporium sp. CCFEE 5018]